MGGVRATVSMPELTMWELIEKKSMPPTRLARYCCDHLKERSTPNRMIATGVRADESQKRANWQAFEQRAAQISKKVGKNLSDMRQTFDDAKVMQVGLGQSDNEENAYDCKIITSAKKNKDIVVNPIINLTEADIWDYIKENHIKVCDLYCRGYKRVGCIGCPMGGRKQQLKEFSEYPTYERAYKRAFKKMLENIKAKGKPTTWKDENDVFLWWTEYYKKNVRGQITIEDYMKEQGKKHVLTIN